MRDKNTDMILYSRCPNCGGSIYGNGYTTPFHCENVESPDDAEPDSGPYYCEDPLETFL